MDVLPVFMFQGIGQPQHGEQEEHHDNSQLHPLCGRRFTQINQVVHQIGHIAVVFCFRERTGRIQF